MARSRLAMDLRLLGPVEAFADGSPVALGPPKQRALLAMLALDAGRTVSGDRLIDGLWGDEPPASATKMVQLYVSQLRRAMDGDGIEIVTRGRGYELRLPDDALDLARFTQLFDAGHAREALALWRGEPLADLGDQPFAPAEIQRLAELRLRAIEGAIDDDIAAGRHTAVIGELDALIAQHPLREQLHARRMLALYRAGRQSEALEAYRNARALLVDEIGVEPGPELQRLHRAILEHDPSLDGERSDATGDPPPPVPDEPGRRVNVVALVAVPVVIAVLVVTAILALAGEDTDLAQIDENAVGVIDAGSGRITSQYAVGRGPGALAAGGGSVWVANSQDGTVAQLQRGRDQVVTLEVGGQPAGLTFGAGSLWVADGEGRTVAQIDPEANKVVQRFDVGNAATAVAVGYGAVWAASAVDGTVARIDLARGRITHRIQAGTRPTAIAAGAGAIWVASDVEASVVRIDPKSNTAVARIATGNAPSAIAVGAGAVWVANRIDGNVSRIDPATDRVTDTVHVGREPRGVAADARSVWVANAGDGSLVKLDPKTRRVVQRVNVGNSPAAVALADDRVWSAAVPAIATHRGGRLRATLSDDDGRLEPEPPDPSSFDPLASLTHDGLVGYRRVAGAAAGAIVPNLARTVPEPSPDGLTYVLRLRNGIRFSNGRPVTPADVRASIERLIMLVSPEGDERYLPIRGVKRCSATRCNLSDGIELGGIAGTVTIHLARPDAEFLDKLANALVVPAASPTGPAATALPGTGPYRIKRWDPDGGLLVRNPHFRAGSPDRPAGFPDEIALRGMTPTDQIASIERGGSDVAVLESGSGHAVTGRARFGTRLHSDATPQTWFLFLNTRAAPFDDARVRRALNYAIDRGRVAELLGSQDTHKPTCQMLPPGFRGYTPSCPFSVTASAAGIWTAPDMAKARRLVAASGTRGMTVEFWDSRPWERLGPYVGSVLRRLGYRPRVRTFSDLSLVIDGSLKGNGRTPQAGLMGWIADSAGPLNFVSPLVSCAGTLNLSRFCDRRIDAAASEAAASPGAEAVDKWRSVDAALARQSPTVPLVNEKWPTLTAKRVGNYQYHPFLGPLLDQMWVK